jgi:hypothetical protein
MQIVVLVLHDERGVVAHVAAAVRVPILVDGAAASGSLVVERLLAEAIADFDVAQACGSGIAGVLYRVSLLCIVASVDSPVRSHALLKHVVARAIRMRRVPLPSSGTARIHLLKALHIARQLRRVHHRDVQIVAAV